MTFNEFMRICREEGMTDEGILEIWNDPKRPHVELHEERIRRTINQRWRTERPDHFMVS